MDDIKRKENEWRNHPIVFFSGLVVLYTVSNSIAALFNQQVNRPLVLVRVAIFMKLQIGRNKNFCKNTNSTKFAHYYAYNMQCIEKPKEYITLCKLLKTQIINHSLFLCSHTKFQ